eukprot:7738989-Lingulodinium_polyedra.AAC.1
MSPGACWPAGGDPSPQCPGPPPGGPRESPGSASPEPRAPPDPEPAAAPRGLCLLYTSPSPRDA